MPQPLYPQGKSPWYPLDRRLNTTNLRTCLYAKKEELMLVQQLIE
jgi:hypothetical protein